MPLLDWLEQCALPEEARLADAAYAASVAAEFVAGLVGAGTTTALVFGAHFAAAVDALFEAAAGRACGSPAGWWSATASCGTDLLTTPRARLRRGAGAGRVARPGRSRYAVTPRFSLSCIRRHARRVRARSRDVDGLLVHLPLNENVAEIAHGARAVPACGTTSTPTTGHGLRRPAQRAGAQRAPDRRRARVLAATRRGGRALPDQQRRARQRALPAAAPRRRAACASRSAPTSAPAPGSRCSRRGCRPTSSSSCSATGAPAEPRHLLHLATAAGADAPGPR